MLEKKKQFFVGILDRKKDFGFVNTKKSKVHTDFFIEQKELKEFKDGEKVGLNLRNGQRGHPLLLEELSKHLAPLVK